MPSMTEGEVNEERSLLTPPARQTTTSRNWRRSAQDAAPAEVPRLVCWSLCLFVFSLLYEMFGDYSPVESTQITGTLLFATALFQPRFLLRRPPLPFWLFVFYLGVGLGHAALSIDGREVLQRLFIAAQLLALCWVCYCALSEERVARAALGSLIAAAVLLAVLSIFHLTITTEEARSRQQRLASFGLDPNQLSGCVGLAILSLLALTYDGRRVFWRFRYVAPLLVGLIGTIIVQTGSRGGLLALAVGLCTFALRGHTLATRVRNVAIVLAAVGFLGTAALQSDVFRRRIESSVETGDMALREASYPISARLVLERPLVGWGPYLNSVEIGRRLNHPAYPRMDTHNLALYVLTATGLLGGVPFFLALFCCARNAWTARTGPHGVLPFALFTALMVADLSVSGLHWKQHWLVIAYSLAAINHLGPIRPLPRGWRRGGWRAEEPAQ